MTIKHIGERIPVQPGLVRFPSICPQCLGNDDLTNYTLKWDKRYREKGIVEVTEKAKVNVPICRACRDSLIRQARKSNAMFFAIFTPISWGLLYALLAFAGAAGWSGWGTLFLFLLAVMPIGSLYLIIQPHSTVKWPIRFATMNTLQIDNGTYAVLFKTANAT